MLDFESRMDAEVYIPWQLRREVFQPKGAEKFARILSDLSGKLSRMDRYERRVLSRRKTAVKAFDAARLADRTAQKTIESHA